MKMHVIILNKRSHEVIDIRDATSVSILGSTWTIERESTTASYTLSAHNVYILGLLEES